MKKKLALLLVLVLTLSLLGACKGKTQTPQQTPEETTSVSAYKSTGTYPEIVNQLSWESVNAFPMKRSDMTPEEARQLAVDFFRFSKTILWIPSDDLTFDRNKANLTDTMTGGEVYGGLPYVGNGSGSIYRLMDYMDQETGVVDVQNFVKKLDSDGDGYLTMQEMQVLGSQCSIGAYWGWGRVINSAYYKWTYDCVEKNGFLRVGPYTYPEDLEHLRKHNTPKILEENGMTTMFESYACIKKGDGLVYYTSAGHVIMSSSDATVVRDPNTNQIDPYQSYITIIDQNQGWGKNLTNEQGDAYTAKTGVDERKNFMKLYEESYIPFTFKEFLGEDPIDETQCDFSHTGETITKDQLFSSHVTANYGISDIYVMIHDEAGNEIYKLAVRSMEPTMLKMKFMEVKPQKQAANTVETWGTWSNTSGKTCTVTIQAQLSTGERPTLWTGKLAQ